MVELDDLLSKKKLPKNGVLNDSKPLQINCSLNLIERQRQKFFLLQFPILDFL